MTAAPEMNQGRPNAGPNTGPGAGPGVLELLLTIEGSAREAKDLTELSHLIANETRKLVRCGQVGVFRCTSKGVVLLAISSLSTVERTAPFVQDLEAAIGERIWKCMQPTPLSIDDLRGADPLRFVDAAYSDYILCPFRTRYGEWIGGMLLARPEPFDEREIKILQRLTAAYAHAWSVLHAVRRPLSAFRYKRPVLIAATIATLLVSIIPVPLTALAPCEIVPLEPETVTAPIDGIIQTIAVEPNQPVGPGTLLLSFVDTTIRGRLEVAERSVEVAAARERRLQQAAFDDRNARRELGIAAAELRLAIAERDAAAAQMARTRVNSSREGIAVFTSRKDWEGRPVATGERIMQIASPDKIQLRIDMPVKDAPVVQEHARVRVYLDSDPLNPLNGELVQATYHAVPVPGGGLAFILLARLSPEAGTPRIGFRGTAQVFGDDVTLIYYVFRRPLTALRQMVGL